MSITGTPCSGPAGPDARAAHGAGARVGPRDVEPARPDLEPPLILERFDPVAPAGRVAGWVMKYSQAGTSSPAVASSSRTVR